MEIVCIKMTKKVFFLAMVTFVAFAASLDSTASLLGRKKLFETSEGVKLFGHVMETLVTDEFGCGLRCLRNAKCRSCNSKSAADRGNMTCELSDQTKQSSPANVIPSPGFTYFGKVVKGWHSSHPGHSCKDILHSGDSTGDGEYWIDPEKNGNSLKACCDMTTDGGGWLLILNIVIDNQNSLPTLSLQTSYRTIDSYGNNKLVLANSAINELRKFLPFTQLRFHCSKPQGRTFHVTTVLNSTGEAVIQYFTGQTEAIPAACGSYKRVKGDNSYLAGQCAKWGSENRENYVGKWGHDQTRELYKLPVFVYGLYHWVTLNNGRWECDDYQVAPAVGDFWKIFVR